MGPGMAAADYDDIGRLAGFGAVREGKAGERLRDLMARHDFDQNEATNRLAEYAGFTRGGSFGGTGVTQTPYYSNPMKTGIGNLTGLLGLGSAAKDAGAFDWLGSLF